MYIYIKNKLNKAFETLKSFNEVFADYILCFVFFNLIFVKLNQFLFEIPSSFLYPVTVFVSIIFINQLLLIANKIKNTYLFNWFLFYFLNFKNAIYGIIFEFIDFFDYEKNQKILIFLIAFIISSWALNIVFFVLNYSDNLSISLFFISLIFSIFNLIESRLIFTAENVSKKNQQIDFKMIKVFLKTNNLTFDKNRPLVYIQRRYLSFNQISNFFKKNGVPLFTGAATGGLITSYTQVSTVRIQKEQVAQAKQQFEKRFAFDQEVEQKRLDIEQQRFNLEAREKLEKSLHEDFTVLEQKLSEKNSYFSKNDNSLHIDHLKMRIEKKKNELDLISLKESNNFDVSKNINESNNSANSVLEDFFF